MSIVWGGVSSDTFGIGVEGTTKIAVPLAKRNVEFVTIPGRFSGDLLEENGGYQPYTQKYTLNWFFEPSQKQKHDVAMWLSAPGWNRFEDDDIPGKFRYACYVGGDSMEDRLHVLGRIPAKFTFKPQFYLTAGELPIEFVESGRVDNDYMDSLPLITVEGSGAGTVTVGSVTISISDIPSSGISIDCEAQDAFSPNGVDNLNSLITLSGSTGVYDYPTIPHGGATVNFTGGVTSVTIVPRWWTLE